MFFCPCEYCVGKCDDFLGYFKGPLLRYLFTAQEIRDALTKLKDPFLFLSPLTGPTPI